MSFQAKLRAALLSLALRSHRRGTAAESAHRTPAVLRSLQADRSSLLFLQLLGIFTTSCFFAPVYFPSLNKQRDEEKKKNKKSLAEHCIRKQIPIRINFSGNSKTFVFQQGELRRAEPQTPGTAELWSPCLASTGPASPQAPSDHCEPPSGLRSPPCSMSLHHPQRCTEGMDGFCSTPHCWAASPILPNNQAASQPSSMPGVAPDFGKSSLFVCPTTSWPRRSSPHPHPALALGTA